MPVRPCLLSAHLFGAVPIEAFAAHGDPILVCLLVGQHVVELAAARHDHDRIGRKIVGEIDGGRSRRRNLRPRTAAADVAAGRGRLSGFVARSSIFETRRPVGLLPAPVVIRPSTAKKLVPRRPALRQTRCTEGEQKTEQRKLGQFLHGRTSPLSPNVLGLLTFRLPQARFRDRTRASAHAQSGSACPGRSSGRRRFQDTALRVKLRPPYDLAHVPDLRDARQQPTGYGGARWRDCAS